MFTQRRRPGGKLFVRKSSFLHEIINKPSSRQKYDNQYNADQRTFDGPRIRVAASKNFNRKSPRMMTEKTITEGPLLREALTGQNKRRTCQFRTNEGHFFSPTKRRKQSKPTPRQPSSAHLAPALSVQIPPPGVSCQHDGNIIY